MYRRLVISTETTKTGPFTVVYYVRGALVTAQRKNIARNLDFGVPLVSNQTPNVFIDSVVLTAQGAVTSSVSYEFILDVDDNQPEEESVRENSKTGVNITVYNANGVIVCHNDVGISPESSPAQPVVPGEMTSEPIEGPGEMTSEPIEAPGEML